MSQGPNERESVGCHPQRQQSTPSSLIPYSFIRSRSPWPHERVCVWYSIVISTYSTTELQLRSATFRRTWCYFQCFPKSEFNPYISTPVPTTSWQDPSPPWSLALQSWRRKPRSWLKTSMRAGRRTMHSWPTSGTTSRRRWQNLSKGRRNLWSDICWVPGTLQDALHTVFILF